MRLRRASRQEGTGLNPTTAGAPAERRAATPQHPHDRRGVNSANPRVTVDQNRPLPKGWALRDGIASRLGEWHCLADAIRDPDRAVFGLDAMARLGLSPLEALLAFRAVTEADAVAAIARHLGLAVVTGHLSMPLADHGGPSRDTGLVLALEGGDPVAAVDALRYSPDAIRRLVDASGWPPQRVVLATSVQWCQALALSRPEELLQHAVTALPRRSPHLAANTPPPLRQLVRLALLPGLVIGASIVAPDGMLAVLAALLTLPFLCVSGLRVAALREALGRRRPDTEGSAELPDAADLPRYSVLVPLYREANILPGLVDALAQLDYPADRLDVILILEADDAGTQEAAALIELAPFMRVVLVPPGEPRTKPRALNYALQMATGEFVCVYDAEDIPEPDQLRRAVALFQDAPPTLACVQGRLNIDNTDGGWLEKQFAIEYTALFDAILPALHKLAIPIPLGGTSNHFPGIA